jgi:hypothetical protein
MQLLFSLYHVFIFILPKPWFRFANVDKLFQKFAAHIDWKAAHIPAGLYSFGLRSYSDRLNSSPNLRNFLPQMLRKYRISGLHSSSSQDFRIVYGALKE